MAPFAPRRRAGLASKGKIPLSQKPIDGRPPQSTKRRSQKPVRGFLIAMKRRRLRQVKPGVTVIESSGASALAPAIKRTPSEVWDRIATFIESPVDLLHLALTCRFLHTVISPVHLSYYSISSSIYCEELEDLANDRRKSAAIRSLTLFGMSGRTRLNDDHHPTSCEQDEHAGSESLLLARRRSRWVGNTVDDPSKRSRFLLPKKMTSCGDGGIERISALSKSVIRLEKLTICVLISELRHLSGFFACLPVLDDFEIHTTTCCMYHREDIDLDASMAALSYIKCSRRRFSWKTGDFEGRGFIIDNFIARFARIVASASETLEELELSFGDETDVDCSPFWTPTYPNLRRLSLRGERGSLTGLRVSPLYIAGSDSLESIRIIGPASGQLPRLQRTDLLRLRSVEVVDEDSQSLPFVLSCLRPSKSGARPIRSLGLQMSPSLTCDGDDDIDPESFETFESILYKARYVEELALMPGLGDGLHVGSDSEGCDRVDWSGFELCFRMVLAYMRDLRVVTIQETALLEWFKACADVPPTKLQAIKIFQDLHECKDICTKRERRWEARIVDLEPLCPELRRVGIWTKKGEGRWDAPNHHDPAMEMRGWYEDRL